MGLIDKTKHIYHCLGCHLRGAKGLVGWATKIANLGLTVARVTLKVWRGRVYQRGADLMYAMIMNPLNG